MDGNRKSEDDKSNAFAVVVFALFFFHCVHRAVAFLILRKNMSKISKAFLQNKEEAMGMIPIPSLPFPLEHFDTVGSSHSSFLSVSLSLSLFLWLIRALSYCLSLPLLLFSLFLSSVSHSLPLPCSSCLSVIHWSSECQGSSWRSSQGSHWSRWRSHGKEWNGWCNQTNWCDSSTRLWTKSKKNCRNFQFGGTAYARYWSKTKRIFTRWLRRWTGSLGLTSCWIDLCYPVVLLPLIACDSTIFSRMINVKLSPLHLCSCWIDLHLI